MVLVVRPEQFDSHRCRSVNQIVHDGLTSVAIDLQIIARRFFIL